MKQFFSLLDGMMEYRQLKEAIEQGRVPVSLTGAAAAHKTHIIASLVYQLQRPALVIVPDESTAIRFAADLNTLLGERVLHFPARDYVLLDVDGASGEFEHQRLGTLSALLRGEARVVVASAESACERTIPNQRASASLRGAAAFSISSRPTAPSRCASSSGTTASTPCPPSRWTPSAARTRWSG